MASEDDLCYMYHVFIMSLTIKFSESVPPFYIHSFLNIEKKKIKGDSLPLKLQALIVELVSAMSTMQVVQVRAGWGYSLVITTAGEMFSWGRNNRGQLGRGKLSAEEERKPK